MSDAPGTELWLALWLEAFWQDYCAFCQAAGMPSIPYAIGKARFAERAIKEMGADA